MATPDTLVLSDTNAASMSSQRDESNQSPNIQNEHDFNPPADPPSHPSSQCAGSKPVPYQDGTTETYSPHIQEDTDTQRADLVQPCVYTALLEMPKMDPGDTNRDFNINSNCDLLNQTFQSHTNISHISAKQEQKISPYVLSESLDVNASDHKPNISTDLTNSLVLDPLEMTYSGLETADGSGNDNNIILTLNNTSPDSPVYPTVDSCTCFVTQTSLSLDEEPNARTKDLPIDNVTSGDSSMMTNFKHIGDKDERDLSQTNLVQTPPDTGDLGTEDTNGVSSKFTGTKRAGEVCNETWLDARQFLAGEEDGAAILDECGHSLSHGPPEAGPDNTKASGFPKREDISIERHAENWELFPSVERWSSTDSWASALSDWFQVYPEDSFTLSPELAMAIQDTSVEQRTCPDITNISGQTYTSVTDEALDNTNGNQGDKDCVPSHSDSDRQIDVIVEDKVNLSEMKAVLDAFNAEMTCGSPGKEFSGGQCGSQHTSGEPWSAKVR